MEIDYSKYTVQQLLEVKQSIDPEIAPENYRNLLNEIDKRSDEVAKLKEQKESTYIQSTFSRVKAVAYLQLVGGAIFILLSSVSAMTEFSAVSFVLIVCLGALSIASGWYLLKDKNIGYSLTYVNQALQLPVIYTSSFVFNYSALGGVFLGLTGSEVGIAAKFDPGVLLLFGEINASDHLSIDLLAVLVIILVGRKHDIDEKIANKQRNTDSGADAPTPVR
ncbi:MAG: hypothetical protein ABW168_04305 [Sedimenticola sp.]